MEKPVLVVLAAGMGSRYGGLKQMDSMGGHGQSIIDYSIYDAFLLLRTRGGSIIENAYIDCVEDVSQNLPEGMSIIGGVEVTASRSRGSSRSASSAVKGWGWSSGPM